MEQAFYPYKSHFLDRDGLKYHYLDEGKGDPVVMLHGNPTWSFYYRELVRELRKDYRTIVPDHMGCGLSDKPADSYYSFTLRQRVDDLEALLEHLGVRERITLVVHDWGGMIGMTYASRYPERIARLVVLNTAAFHLPKGKKLPLALKICRDTQLGAFLVQTFNLFAIGAAKIGCKRKPMNALLRQTYCKPYDSWHNRLAILRFVQDIPLKPGDSSYALVSEVEAGLGRFADRPMAIFWGEKDFVFDRQFRDEWVRRFPQAELHSYPDVGHYVLEDAGDEIIPLIRRFLRAHPLSKKPAWKTT